MKNKARDAVPEGTIMADTVPFQPFEARLTFDGIHGILTMYFRMLGCGIFAAFWEDDYG